MKKSFYLLLIFLFFTYTYSQGKESTYTIKVNSGWNLLSLPATMTDSLKSLLFPNAASPAFIYDKGYRQKDTLNSGYGFWIKFNLPETISITGTTAFEDTIPVKTGWNLIGSLSMPIAVNTIISDPPEIIASQFYAYNNRYQTVDTLQPGSGYWVKVNQNGSIILSSDSIKIITLSDSTILPELDSSLVSVSLDSNSLTLTYSSAQVVPQFEPGNVLVGMSGEGYLRKVVTAEYQNNSVILTTTNASFDEAFVTGIADTSFYLLPPADLILSNISYNDEIKTKNGLQYITVNSDQISLVRLLKTNSFLIKIPNFNLRIGVPINQAGPYLSVGIDTIKLTLSFRPQIYLNFRTGNFKLLVQKGLKTELINVSAFVSGELNLESDEFKLIPTIPLGVIPVVPPVVFIPSLDLVALIEADFAVGRNINLGSYFLSEFNTTIGAEIKNGVWTTTKTTSHTGDADLSIVPDDSGDGFSFSGEARFVLLKPKLNFKINGLIGPNLFVKGFEYNKLMFPPLRAELGFGVSAGAEFKFKVFRKTIADFSVDFFDYRWPFFERTFGNLPPSKPSNPFPPDSSNNQPLSLSLVWQCNDPEGDPITYNVYFGTTNPPTTIVSNNQTGTTLARSGLSHSTTYFWKVVAKDSRGDSTTGSVWRFTTQSGGGSSCVGTPTVTYGGKIYNTVQIGTQCWLRENLDVGTMIDSLQNSSNNGIIEKYCYNNDPANCSTYGGLYQWNEAMQYVTTPGTIGICPNGWHIPTESEFQTLSTIIGGDGNALKAIGQGTGVGAGTNTSGFSALLTGYKTTSPYHFADLGHITYLWSSSPHFNVGGRVMYVYSTANEIGVSYALQDNGHSIRCLKDDQIPNNPPNQPSNPYPEDNTIGVSTDTGLSWSCSDPDGDPLTYDVYFGTNADPPLAQSNHTSASYSPGILSNNTQYYWKIVARDNKGATNMGSVWNFTTSGSGGFPCVGIPTITYSDKTYNTVQIGSQCWLKENLDVGTRIDGIQEQTNNSTIEKYCYNNDPNNCNTYGGLYQWNEAMQYVTTPGAQGICPSGWHLPTEAEFQILSTTVGGDGNALKAIGQGSGAGAGTNTSGFSALLAGARHYEIYFAYLGYYTSFWGSTEHYSTYANHIRMYYLNSGIDFLVGVKEWGVSVRCVKD